VDLEGWAGDTLTRAITVPAGFIQGRVFTAQVRSAADASIIDATFTVIPPVGDTGLPAYLTLSSATTAGLVTGGVISTRVVSGRTVTQGIYKGVWDVQLAPAGGGDPTTTLCQGKVTITGDVTRP
jgi:hypothetical protein